MTSQDLPKYICLPASEGGHLVYVSPDGRMTDLHGREVARASPSAPPASVKARRTKDTSGPSCVISSPSADLQRSLENRLRARTDVNGSLEYVLIWKHWTMQSGPPICALRARARPTYDNDYTGWPTPTSALADKGVRTMAGGVAEAMRSRGPDLAAVACLAGWPTPMAGSPATDTYNEAGNTDSSRKTVELVGWATPTTRDHKDGGSIGTAPVNALLGRQVWTAGPITTSFIAQTGKRAALNPAHSRWLMGYPTVWDVCAPTATRSSRKSRPRS